MAYLVLVILRCRAAFQIADVGIIFGDNQRSLKLAGVGCIDPADHHNPHILKCLNDEGHIQYLHQRNESVCHACTMLFSALTLETSGGEKAVIGKSA